MEWKTTYYPPTVRFLCIEDHFTKDKIYLNPLQIESIKAFGKESSKIRIGGKSIITTRTPAELIKVLTED